jgi:hypothetical protein
MRLFDVKGRNLQVYRMIRVFEEVYHGLVSGGTKETESSGGSGWYHRRCIAICGRQDFCLGDYGYTSIK